MIYRNCLNTCMSTLLLKSGWVQGLLEALPPIWYDACLPHLMMLVIIATSNPPVKCRLDKIVDKIICQIHTFTRGITNLTLLNNQWLVVNYCAKHFWVGHSMQVMHLEYGATRQFDFANVDERVGAAFVLPLVAASNLGHICWRRLLRQNATKPGQKANAGTDDDGNQVEHVDIGEDEAEKSNLCR